MSQDGMKPATCSYRCEQVCAAWSKGDNCNDTLCLVTDIFWACFFGICSILLAIRLYQFFKHQPKPRFTLKKLIFIFGIAACLIRCIRFSLMAANIPQRMVYIQLLWMWSGSCFVLMFSLLMMFWANLIRKGRMPFHWLGKRMRLYFIIFNIAFFLILTFMGIMQDFSSGSTWARAVNLSANILGVILCSGLGIAALYEGFTLISLLKQSGLQTMRDSALVRKISLLSISTAIGNLLLVVFTLIITALNSVSSLDYVQCHVTHLIFTTLFSIVIGILLVPMADFRVERPESSPKNDSKDSKEGKKNSRNQTATTDVPSDPITMGQDLTTSTMTVESLAESGVRGLESNLLLTQEDSNPSSRNSSVGHSGDVEEKKMDILEDGQEQKMEPLEVDEKESV